MQKYLCHFCAKCVNIVKIYTYARTCSLLLGLAPTPAGPHWVYSRSKILQFGLLWMGVNIIVWHRWWWLSHMIVLLLVSWFFTSSPSSVLSAFLGSWILMRHKYQQIYNEKSILFKICLRYNSLMFFSSSLGYNSDLRRKRFKAYLYIGLDSLNNHYERLFEHLFRADILIHKCYSKCYFLCNSLLSKNI